jgi:hypothetical protein
MRTIMKTFSVIYKPTGELVLEAAARQRREREAKRRPKLSTLLANEPRLFYGETTRLMNEVGFPALRRSAA